MAVADVKLIMSIRFPSDSSGVLRGSDRIFPGLLVHCIRWSSRIMLEIVLETRARS